MADQKTNTPAANLPPTLQTQLTAARNKASEAQLRYTADKSAENLRAYQQAAVESLTLEIQNGTFEGNVEAMKLLAQVAPGLMKARAEAQGKLANSAADKDVQLQLELTQDQRKELDHELVKIYDLGLSGQQTTVNLLGMARGFAAFLGAFGVDCSGFIQRCDDGIKNSLNGVEHIKYERLGDINKAIDLKRANSQLNGGYDSAINGIDPDKAKMVFEKLMGLGTSGSAKPDVKTSASATTPEPKGAKPGPVETTKAISAAHGDGKGITLKHPEMLDEAIRKSAAIDHDVAHLTKAELIDLNARLITLEGKDNAAEILRRINNEAKAGVGMSNNVAQKAGLPEPAPR